MGDVPSTNNTLVATVNQAINVAMSLGEGAVEAAIIAEVPFLGLPGLKQGLGLILGWLESYFYDDAAAVATSIIVDLQISAETTATQTAFNNVQAAIQGGDPVAIQKASTDLDSAFAGLVHSDGSSSP
jgi:hypothetical protein